MSDSPILLITDTEVTKWNITDEYVPTDEIPPYITIMFIIIGTIGNILVCLAILLDRKLQNHTNYFLLSLAVADLLVSLIILPSRMVIVRFKLSPSLFKLCFLYLVGDDFVSAASAIHICFISVERYIAIKNRWVQTNFTTSEVAIKIGLIWFISFITIIPYMISAIMTPHPNDAEYCASLLSNFKFFDAIVFIEGMVIIIMIVIVVVSFIMTANLLYKLPRQQEENKLQDDVGLVENMSIRSEDKLQTKKMIQENKKTLTIVWMVSFAFVICMMPYTFLNLLYFFFPAIIIPPIILEISAYLSYANSLINPFIYTLCHKTFRRNFHNLIQFKYKQI